MTEKKLTKDIGKRILSEANDLKRTLGALAKDICMNENILQDILDGNCQLEDSYEVIRKMGNIYPIDVSDLYLLEDDCKNGVKIMRAKESTKSSRVFSRLDKKKELTPYYEYRDTAMSKISPYKPEWIKELRIVENNDPYNPDVIYNNGHFLHQTTFFVGPVNFYWQINGKKYCREMNTGDSNYITPYWPHSFTNRDATQEAYIVAVTFGGDVRRAQKELYALGQKSKNYVLEFRDHNKAIRQLIKQHMMNENMTMDHLINLIEDESLELDLYALLNENTKISTKDLRIIALLLNIELDDLTIPIYKPEEEVVVKHSKLENKYAYPGENNVAYKIEALARTSKMPLVKGFSLEVLTNHIENNLITSLHTFIYNYGNSDVNICWENDGHTYKETIKKFDSLYIKPFINHGFSCSDDDGNLYVVRVSGSINLSTQRELSYMSNVDRVFNETKCWFD